MTPDAESEATKAALAKLIHAHAELSANENALTVRAYEDAVAEIKVAFEPIRKRSEAKRARNR